VKVRESRFITWHKNTTGRGKVSISAHLPRILCMIKMAILHTKKENKHNQEIRFRKEVNIIKTTNNRKYYLPFSINTEC
jgi:hypothetical protein